MLENQKQVGETLIFSFLDILWYFLHGISISGLPHEIGSKTSILSSKDKNFGAESYSIGIYGFKGITKYKITVMIEDNLENQSEMP